MITRESPRTTCNCSDISECGAYLLLALLVLVPCEQTATNRESTGQETATNLEHSEEDEHNREVK